MSGPAPDRRSYGSFVSFSDPDGNGWLLQEITTRLPGRIDPGATSFASASDLASASGARNGTRRAREAYRAAGRGVARLVRRVHGRRAGRHGAADVRPQRSKAELRPATETLHGKKTANLDTRRKSVMKSRIACGRLRMS